MLIKTKIKVKYVFSFDETNVNVFFEKQAKMIHVLQLYI